jgi:phage terminase large subunit-like protein
VKRRDDHLKAKLRQWSRDGWIDLSADQRISHLAMKDQVVRDAKQFDIKSIGYDSWNAYGIEEDLSKVGLLMIDVKQTTPVLDGARKEFQLLANEHKLYHGFNPVLAWNVSNVVINYDNLDRAVIGKKRNKDKIDGVSAAVNALNVVRAKPPSSPQTIFIPMGRRS